jgi:hypothetical protein
MEVGDGSSREQKSRLFVNGSFPLNSHTNGSLGDLTLEMRCEVM